MSDEEYDAVVIGSGPNGLSAAVALAQAGASVLVLEGKPTYGGGMRTEERTLPGFRHDVCSAAHPTGVLSPYLRTLPLAEHGLEWCQGASSFAHPLDGGAAVLHRPSLEETMEEVGVDAEAYRRLLAPFLDDPHGLLGDVLAPLKIPRHPILLTRFGLEAFRSAAGLAARFEGERARALLAGCAAHVNRPLDELFTAAVGLMFMVTGHVESWPVARGGTASIADALVSLLRSLGGAVRTGAWVRDLNDLPPARVYVFDTDPRQLADIAGPVLPSGYVRRLRRYRYGPGTFKIDFALDGSIPWRDPRCRDASTVHLGGTLEEIAASEAAVWRGEHPARPYVLLCQQSELDPTRAPAGQHTGYAYCHVPAGSREDLTEVLLDQIERFAPGLRERLLEVRAMTAVDFAAHNPNYVGGAITGGVADATQLFTRPVARLHPHGAPNPRVYLASASTPPGGGVHGMCGYYAAELAIGRMHRFARAPLAPRASRRSARTEQPRV